MKSPLLPVAISAVISFASTAHAVDLRLSHQWSNKDIRHQVAQMAATQCGRALRQYASWCHHSEYIDAHSRQAHA